MARIEGVFLPKTKRIEYGLTYVFGIGLKSSRDILNKCKIDFNTRVNDLSHSQVAQIQKIIIKITLWVQFTRIFLNNSTLLGLKISSM